MNQPQRVVLLAFVVAVALAGAFPPWKFEAIGFQRRPAGFHFIFSLPQHPITETETAYVPDETKPRPVGKDPADVPPCPKSGNAYLAYLCESAREAAINPPAPTKAVTKTIETGRINGQIDFTKLLIEWVTVCLIAGALLLMLNPRGSGSPSPDERETPAP